MSARRGAGRVFPAIAFTVIGAVTATLLHGLGPARDTARGPAAGPADIGFSQDMIVHHQQAVTMAQTVRGRVSPSVAGLASAIELGQLREIGWMQGWLALWDAPQTPAGPPMAWMTGSHPGHPGHGGRTVDRPMPGLADQEELERLGGAEGRDADVRFLQLMIRHHEGGLMMTTAAAERATHPRVRDLATLMTTEQHKEIATMTGLLAALGHRPLPSPVHE